MADARHGFVAHAEKKYCTDGGVRPTYMHLPPTVSVLLHKQPACREETSVRALALVLVQVALMQVAPVQVTLMQVALVQVAQVQVTRLTAPCLHRDVPAKHRGGGRRRAGGAARASTP
jgi:hypothetical protein